MSIALVTNYIPPYRVPLYELLAERYGVEVYCFGGEADYVPEALRDLDGQIEQASFPAHKLKRQRDASALAIPVVSAAAVDDSPPYWAPASTPLVRAMVASRRRTPSNVPMSITAMIGTLSAVSTMLWPPSAAPGARGRTIPRA